MITVETARLLIDKHVKHQSIEHRDISTCVHYVSAETLSSPFDSPPFAQSAMDGYAFRFADLENQHTFELQGIIQAGDTNHYILERQKCFRIFTGAPIPEGADTVIMQEYCLAEHSHITFNQDAIRQGANVRPRGSQVQANEIVLKKHTKLNPGIIGYLASLGIQKVKVYAKPKVGILVTGNELIKPGEPLQHGQIYESNSVMLQAALAEGGITCQGIYYSQDNLSDTVRSIECALQDTDFLLISGGISVGEYDYVQEALEKNKVSTVFHKIKQKPGKPFYFGIKEHRYVFALPGNPASVLTCFYEYVVPALRKFSGGMFENSNRMKQPLLHDYNKKDKLTHFLKGYSSQEGVLILGAQESYKLNAFTEANCLVMIEEEQNTLAKGDEVEVHMLNKIWHD